MNLIHQYGFNQGIKTNMQVTGEYQQENTTDLSRIKIYDGGRKISAMETMKKNKKKSVDYKESEFNPRDKSNWRF